MFYLMKTKIQMHFLWVACLFFSIGIHAQFLSGDCDNGTGSALADSSVIYTGTFKNGLPNGQGIYSNAFGRIYEGGVWNGTYHGRGKLVYDNGDIYVGEFKQGLRHGKGIFT